MELHIQIKIQGDGFPTADEFDTRVMLEDLLTDNNVGDVVGAGAGEGVMDLYVEVEDPDAAQPIIQTLVDQCGLTLVTTIRLVTTGA